ncbi:hypothetical protein OWR29_09265 [Actinoplanes sp. Pm04-4]|uniref:CARDB domain-containing protein n=1 Tax=Paractinoplanes pyxinae TaxID=2997416 RepID=A0ABT4AVB7_9ACTN|nr:hypothetical protein [Actinoplanes pyxinae]MCY1138185.1 hypothetical protein [Actinoplanes pyxinae]
MTDHDPLTAAFDEFRSQAATMVKPVGAERTHEVVRTRKRRRGLTLGALATLVVAVPLTVAAVLPGDPQGPPTGSPPSAPQVSASAHYFVGPGQNVNPSTTAPAGGLSEAGLYSATLDLPAWPAEMNDARCPTGPVPFRAGDTVVNDANLWIAGVVHADIDQDGQAETLARVFCMNGNDIGSQVVAFGAAPGGGVRTIGPVLQQGGAVVAICGVRAGTGGAVQVETADFPVPWRCADADQGKPRYVTRQWLTFTWNGSAFVQQGTTPPTTNKYATDLELTSTDLVLTRQGNGHYVGSMTLTVRNTGTSAIPYKTQTVVSDGMKLVDAPPGCALDRSQAGGGMVDILCTATKITGGATRTVTLKVDSPRRYTLTYVPDTNILPLDGFNDPNEANNRAPLTIEFRD